MCSKELPGEVLEHHISLCDKGCVVALGFADRHTTYLGQMVSGDNGCGVRLWCQVVLVYDGGSVN